MNNGTNRYPITIVLEEDDDDDEEEDDDVVHALSPPRARSTLQWNALPATLYTPSRPPHIPVLDDDDLELRLGPSENRPASSRLDPIAGRHTRTEASPFFSVSNFSDSYFFPTIDLTCTNDNFETKYKASLKRKRFPPPPERPRELKLTCAICMDTMEEETSTICGHIFCRKCILEAMKTQKKCPTCRRRLANSQIHRIYLS